VKKSITVIDLFAGPGGLSEGFSRFKRGGEHPFKVAVSVEKEPFAHQTLLLRSFVRQFLPAGPPAAYYRYVERRISREELFAAHAAEASRALAEVLRQPRELGNPGDDSVIRETVRSLRDASLAERRVLIGGPPCQAYSLAGRSRRAREARQSFEQDEKHYLYREYLEIVRLFKPTVFVMENVKGLLSATVDSRRMFRRILDDLTDAGYTLCSLSHPVMGLGAMEEPDSFVVRAEEYGIPQKRHRLFVVGVANGFPRRPGLLRKAPGCFVRDAIGDLPRIRSHISPRVPKQGPLAGRVFGESLENWLLVVREHANAGWFPEAKRPEVARFLAELGRGVVDSREYIAAPTWGASSGSLRRWCRDKKLGGVLQHTGRSHMPDDLLRYFFVAASGAVTGTSPKLDKFPPELRPDHANVTADQPDVPHADRFKVQLAGQPSSTVTCHISKDGHYYIHPDPTQCRSLTVREAARLQTFPDNYFFEGPRTEQYRQVGNAVPPLLAYQIAEIVAELLGVD
jgi:DNA (cytosine-5)-methyltransferase 1